MKLENKLKLQNILFIVVIALIFGLCYNLFFYPHTFIEFLEAGSIGVLIGLFIGILEEFVLKFLFERKSALFVVITRTLLYSFLISIILSLVLAIEVSFNDQLPYAEAVIQYIKSPLFQRDFIFSIGFIIFVLFMVQIIQLIGRVNFFKLFFGLYHQPREVSRIFMFLDLKNSTGIAEKMSNKMYSSFIKDFFYDISDVIIMFKGEVYQYAGDEVIVVWPIKKDNNNCINSFFKMEAIIESRKNIYLSKYNMIPEFKAGIHIGQVVVTTVGKHKKEIVYHGDVLNTTSRIEGKCNELNQKLLISETLLPHLQLNPLFYVKEKGKIELKGKSQKLSLFGIQLATRP